MVDKTLKTASLKHSYDVLKENNWFRRKTAEDLNVHYRTMTNMIQEMKKRQWEVGKSDWGRKTPFPTNKKRLAYLDR